MKNLHLIEQVYNFSEKFIGGSYLCLEDASLKVAVKLQFEKSSLYLIVDGHDDTLFFSRQPPNHDDYDMTTDSVGHHFLKAQGCIIRFFWSLTNNGNYTDGFQMNFHNPEDGTDVVIQFIAVASTIEISVVTKIGKTL